MGSLSYSESLAASFSSSSTNGYEDDYYDLDFYNFAYPDPLIGQNSLVATGS